MSFKQPIKTDDNLIQSRSGTDIELSSKRISDSDQDETDKSNLRNQQFLSSTMQLLRQVLQQDDRRQFQSIALSSQLVDTDESLILLFVACVCFNDSVTFNKILQRNNNFRIRPECAKLLVNPMKEFQKQGALRSKLDQIVLKASIDKEVSFITDLILSTALVTHETIIILFEENQNRQLINLILKASPSKYQPMRNSRLHYGSTNIRKLEFYDIIEAAVFCNVKSSLIIDVLKLMYAQLDKLGGVASVDRQELKKIERDNLTDAEFITLQLDYEEFFLLFVSQRNIKLLRYLYNLPQEQFKCDHVKFFTQSLELNAFDIAALIHKEFFRLLRDASQQQEEIILQHLVSGFNQANGMAEYKCYLIRQYLERLQLRHATRILEAVDIKVMTNSKSNIIVINLNVVKTSCLLIEMLHNIGSRFQSLQVRSQQIRMKIVAITSEYMRKVEHEEEMKYLLLDRDIDNRDSLDLITEHTIQEFLSSQHAENVVREIWRSSYATQDSIFTASTNHMLTFHYWNCVRDLEKDQPWWYIKNPNELESHPMQFTVWRFSPKARTIIEFIVTLAFAIAIHFILQYIMNWQQLDVAQWVYYQDMVQELGILKNTTSKAYMYQNATTSAYYSQIEPQMTKFFHMQMEFTYVGFCILFFALQHIPEIIYTSITKRVFNPYAFKNLLDFLIFCLFFSNIWVTYHGNLGGTWKEKQFQTDEYRMNVYMTNYSYGKPERETWLLISCEIALWIRVVFLLRYNEYLGKITGILEKIAYDLVIYFLFFLIEILVFAFIFEMSFRTIGTYNDTLSSFRTLFYSAFGQFDFIVIRNSEYGEYFGVAFLVIFLVVNIGLFMSFFISMITVLYEINAADQNVHHMIQTLRTRPVMKADKYYSCLISIPPPLNATLLVLAPFLLVSSNPELWNKVILWVAYLPILLVTSTLFLIYSLVLMPVTFVKLVFHKLVMIFVYSKSYRVTKADKFMTWILFCIVGVPRLFLNVFTDYFSFLKHMVQSDLRKTKVCIRQKPISKKTTQHLYEYFDERKERMVPFKQVSAENRDNLQIQQKIRALLMPAQQISFVGSQLKNTLTQNIAENQLSELNPLFENIREYNTVKHFLDCNSQTVLLNSSKIRSVDCKMMSVLVSEITRQHQIQKVYDQNYIFVRRAVTIKDKAALRKQIRNRAKMGKEAFNYLEDPKQANYDFDKKMKQEKRIHKVAAKLTYLKTARLLKIIGYQTSEVDTKRLEYAVNYFGNGKFTAKALQNKNSIESQVKGLHHELPNLEDSMHQVKNQVQMLINNMKGNQNQQHLQQILNKLYKIQPPEVFKDEPLEVSTAQEPIKPVKKVALKDLRQKSLEQGYQTGDDSDVPYMSDNIV